MGQSEGVVVVFINSGSSVLINVEEFDAISSYIYSHIIIGGFRESLRMGEGAILIEINECLSIITSNQDSAVIAYINPVSETCLLSESLRQGEGLREDNREEEGELDEGVGHAINLFID